MEGKRFELADEITGVGKGTEQRSKKLGINPYESLMINAN
jgi:hypothetical protein